MPVCEACLSTDIRVRAKRRRTGAKILQCRKCGLRMLDLHYSLDETSEGYDVGTEHIEQWNSMLRESVAAETWPENLAQMSQLVGGTKDRSLFDIGANDATFLDAARKAGFEPHGNELSSGAIAIAKERFGIELLKGDLSRLDDAGKHDVVTMWCVLAHVPDGDQLLSDARNILEPKGVLFMQTPRWTSMDEIALTVLELTRGRVSRVVDRRTPGHHLRFHTTRSITAQLDRLGYEVISVRPRARYSLATERYLRSLGIGPRIRKVLVPPLNALLRREIFFRIVLDVYARKREQPAGARPAA